MSGVFISYRRDDSAGHAGRIFDRLALRFGADHVFLDVGTIRPGTDFVDAIEQAITACDVVLAVIGPRWASLQDEGGRRRLDLENDFIRLEIETALQGRIPLLPVLVGGAAMPSGAELPTGIARLARLDALEIGDHRFDQDVKLLIETVEELGRATRAAEGRPTTSVDQRPTDEPRTIDRMRKVVTVLAVGLEADESRSNAPQDPEVARRVVDDRADAMREVVTRFGGTIGAPSGGCVLAYFGVPRAHEDDSERAVRAALQLITTMGPRARIGIDTGEVLVEEHGDRPAVEGAPVHGATELATICTPGGVLLGSAVHRAVRSLVIAEPPEAGDGGPWRLIGLEQERGSVLRPSAPILGRVDELRLLEQAFERAARERACHLFTVIGGAGVGKSRLASEFLGSVADRSTQLVGNCLAYGEGITYWPIGEIVRSAAGIAHSDTQEQAVHKIERLLEHLSDRDLVVARILQVLGISESSAAPEEIFWAIRRLLEHVAASGPVIVVVEDIHWAEPTLLDLLDHLTDWSDGAPILLLCMARNELLDHRPGWGGGKRNATTIGLEPLSGDEANQLIDRLLGGSGDQVELRAQVTAAAEGNPLFIEEMIGMLIDDGTLGFLDGVWTAVRDLAGVEVPPTISALLAARLDQLADHEREAIQRASVQGREFFRGALESLCPPQLRARLAVELLQLVRRELIRSSPTVEFAGEDGFLFRHILIRDAAYGTLPKQLRAELHGRFADWIEWRAGDRAEEFVEIIGYHLEQAFRYEEELEPGSPGAAELAGKAGRVLANAGGRAYRRGDMPAAVNLFSRVVDLLPAQDARALHVMPELGEALYETGDLSRADDMLSRAIQGAEAIADPGLEAYATIVRSLLRILTEPTGWTDEARSAAERALPMFEAAGDEAALAKTSELMHHVHVFHGRYADAATASERAAAHAASAGQDLQRARHLAIYAATSVFGPTPVEEGLRRCREAIVIAGGYPTVEPQVWLGMAGLEAMEGRFDEARRLVGEARDRWTELGMQLSTASSVAQYSGFVEMLAGDWPAAERELRLGMDALERMGEQGVFSSVAATLARAVYEQGRPEEADRLVEVSRLAAAPDDIDAHVQWQSVRGRLLCDRGLVDEAERQVREALELAQQTDDVDLQTSALMDLAVVLRRAGRIDAASRCISAAIDLCDRKGNRVASSRCRAALGDLQA
jgi:class 3 adenylate cyclase/tetratricopeptide (TPR) repeat protein